jgi:hypothetical protein
VYRGDDLRHFETVTVETPQSFRAIIAFLTSASVEI